MDTEWSFKRGGGIQIRRLKNLDIREVSLVDSAANLGAKITLHKRADDKPTAPAQLNAVEVAKRADVLWSGYVELIQKRDRCTQSAAIDRALRDPIGADLFDTARKANLAKQQHLMDIGFVADVHDVRKMGGAAGFTHDGINHGDSSNEAGRGNPFPTVEHDVDEDGDYADASKAYQSFVRHVAAYQRSGMKHFEAFQHAIRVHGRLWQAAKRAKASDAIPYHQVGRAASSEYHYGGPNAPMREEPA
jgi:hypothetical protein